MSDYTNCYHTKSSYTKTGKKVKCISSGRTDLIYKKVYDVFVDNGGHEFVIDESCDRLYDSMEFPLWIEVFDDDDDKGFDSTTSKPQFKVGDKVKVVGIDYISAFTDNIKVGNTGDIICIGKDYIGNLYQVKFEDGIQKSWWFTDECIKLVENVADDANIENKTTKSESVVVRKFKVGDTVRVTSIDYIREHTETFKVGDIEVIIDVDDDDYDEVPYKIRDWWFSESELELVTNDNSKTPIVSDGGSSSYYAQQIPKGMLERFNATGTIEAKDVIRLFLGNDFNMGNIFKAYCRVISLRNGKGKAGIDEQYDLTKAKFFTEDELNYYLENKDV